MGKACAGKPAAIEVRRYAESRTGGGAITITSLPHSPALAAEQRLARQQPIKGLSTRGRELQSRTQPGPSMRLMRPAAEQDPARALYVPEPVELRRKTVQRGLLIGSYTRLEERL